MKYLIVGLGNVGHEYENTRHNIGFMAVDRYAHQAQASFSLARHAMKADAKWAGRQLILLKPTTLMNLSGKAVKYWAAVEHIAPENILIIVDDLALPTGTLRLRKEGSAGGHNGLADIEQCLGTNRYSRLRIGIGNNFGRGHQVDYVLGEFTAEEQALLDPALTTSVDIIKSFVTQGVDRTMNQYNKR
ncbi:MAG: aminoacyl-tRNA hydrolase [Bacteroidales bacterium]|nr:aminoacyl-tRNA hydrolase [Bacteroidales bacterium]